MELLAVITTRGLSVEGRSALPGAPVVDDTPTAPVRTALAATLAALSRASCAASHRVAPRKLAHAGC